MLNINFSELLEITDQSSKPANHKNNAVQGNYADVIMDNTV